MQKAGKKELLWAGMMVVPPEGDVKVTFPEIRDNTEDPNPLGVYTCFRPDHTLRRTLVHLKDPTPLRRRAGVVYQIPCGNCEKLYIGQRGRTLDDRLKEHRRALISGNVRPAVGSSRTCLK